MGSSGKEWDRPWSMDEIVENAENWSLAGDVALLNSLKAFSDNMITKSNAISDNIDNLLNNLDNVSLRLDISKNEFQSLRNVQFIESRVYEEDETLAAQAQNDSKIEDENFSEEEKNKIIKNSIALGLNVMEQYFDTVQIHNDEGEIETKLQMKNLYADRPLPPLIGSQEWYESFEPDVSESASTPISDNEIETENSLNIKGSETSSELDLTPKSEISKPLMSSTLSESTESVPIAVEQAPLPFGSKNFADELSSKLGNVLKTSTENVEPEINTKPIQKVPPSNKVIGNLFSEEPPPLDGHEDDTGSKNVKKGLFSGGEGLFDEDDDDLFSKQTNNQSQTSKNLFDDENESLPPKISPAPVQSKVTKGLFDSSESSDDDLFSTSKKQPTKPPLLQPFKTTAPLFDEEPPALDEESKNKPVNISVKAPAGSVSQIFPELQKKLAQNRRDSSESSDSKSSQEKNIPPIKIANNNESKIPNKSLFDDDDDEDLFVNKNVQEKTKPNTNINKNSAKNISLFDDEDKELFNNDENTQESSSTPVVKEIPSKKLDLFGDEDDDLFGGDLFGKKTTKMSLFDDDDDDLFTTKTESKGTKSNSSNEIINTENKEVNDDKTVKSVDEVRFESSNSINSDPVTKSATEDKPITAQNQVKGLFDDSDDDDLFRQPVKHEKTLPLNEGDLFGAKTELESEKSPIKVSLFDSTPPPVDETDDWESKSDNIYEDSDQNDDYVTQQSNLFDNEPPLLIPNETSSNNTTVVNEVETNNSDTSSLSVSQLRENSADKIDTLNNHESSSVNNIGDIRKDDEMEPKPKPSPGKLKHNLNINVNALMPGYVPRRKELVKSQSLDFENGTTDVRTSEVPSSGAEKPAGFDSVDNTNILHSVTKHRARPVKRRPSSRRARQENLRKSVPDFSLYGSVEEVDIKSDLGETINNTDVNDSMPSVDKNLITDKGINLEKPETTAKSSESELEPQSVDVFNENVIKTKSDPTNSLFDDSDDDFFKPTPRKSITEQTNEQINKIETEQTVIKPEIKTATNAIKRLSVFDDKEDSDDDLFPNLQKVPISKPVVIAKNSQFLNSPDSDDDLFTSSSGKINTQAKTNLDSIFESNKSQEKASKQDIFGSESDEDDLFTSKQSKPKKTERKALFDDDSNDDDDIFGSSKSVPKQGKNEFIKKDSVKVNIKTSNIRKLENVEAVEDPLSDLLK